jgi:two-component system sensor histidine kinase PilS (NtrC family)
MDPMSSSPDSQASASPLSLAPPRGIHRHVTTGAYRFTAWGAPRWLFLVRLLMVAVLALVFSPLSPSPLAEGVEPRLAWVVLSAYGILVLLSGLSLYARWPSRQNQVYLALFVDIVAFALLMHAAGGVESGLGVLLAVAVAAGALMMEGRLSLLFAALATLAVITQQIVAHLEGAAPASGYTHAGLLGVLFFTVALLAHLLYRRLHAVEALAARRQVDIDDLSKLNDYIIQNMGTGILVVDGERRLRMMNQAARDLLGTPDPPPGAALRRLSPAVADWLDTHVQPWAPQGGMIQAGERELKPSRHLLGTTRANGVLLFLRDNQELIREAQQIKLASLGTLTASIAHNIRNPLSSIAHAGQLLGESETLGQDDRHLVEIIRRNSGRIDEIVRSVLQLSRRNQVEPRLLDLVPWLLDLCSEFRESHGLGTENLQLRARQSEILVEVDPRHLHQIVFNLCENALIHGGTPAHIQVRVAVGLGPDKAVLEVRDEGPGIAEDTVREMFDPFYTTRAGGTGLGLYIARELAETNGIRLQYERLQPRGSCFRLSFG